MTEFTTAGLIVPSFFMRSVKFHALEDGINDIVLLIMQGVMYVCFLIRLCTWFWSLCRMQPLIREIEKHITEETELRKVEAKGTYSKRRRSNVAVIIVRVIFISSFLFHCLLCNYSFQTNPNSVTNCFKLILFYLQLYKLHLLNAFVYF